MTGWDRDDYTVLLNRKRDTVVLEMGNPNVTDDTLQLLMELPQLKELTLNNTLITDASFETIKQLPALESLRLARTKITKEGVATFLADPPPKLRQIDVSGNSIPTSALRKWKNADGENRRYLN